MAVFWIILLCFSPVWSSSRNCTFLGQPGWRCDDGQCLDREWICDEHVQCKLPDESDEVEGCQLFPETGCKSWYGLRHQKCSNGRCVTDLSECPLDSSETTGGEPAFPTTSSCPSDLRDPWRCNNGMCIDRSLVCDGRSHCDDGSDEIEGCRMFPEEGCLSWFGKKHVKCQNHSHICTLPELSQDDCRKCDNVAEWRCNDGLCIPAAEVQNGLKNCVDGSDEEHDVIVWWQMALVTLIVAITGIVLSFLFRFLKNKKSIFDCVFCRSHRANRIRKQRELSDFADGHNSTLPLSEPDFSQVLPLELLELFEKSDSWREKRKSLNRKSENRGQHLYAKVHCDPVIYKNLYRYLCSRFSTPSKLKGCTEQLFRWEKDFHGQNVVEAVACWRLHLGSSETCRRVHESVQPPGVFNKFFNFWMPLKDRARTTLRACLRKNTPEEMGPTFKAAYNVWNTVLYLVQPFVGASFYYFDILKDLIFAKLIFSSIIDLSKGNFTPREYPFEFGIILGLSVAFLTNQVIHMVISSFYSTCVFEMCEHTASKWKMWLFKGISITFAPLMPAFLLANYVYYLQLGYSKQRVLQTWPEDQQHNMAAKAEIFQDIEDTHYRSKLHRRIYSFFRVSTAVIQSFHMIVVIVVMLVVSPSQRLPLVEGVTEKIADFLGIPGREGSMVENLDLVRDTVILFAIIYSMGMILSALIRYVNQCKDSNLLLGGKIFLSLYFVCHITARLTLFIALIATSQATETKTPAISLLPASLLGVLNFIIHFILIYWFKLRHVPNFDQANRMEQFVHVLLNTLVTLPYMKWDVDEPKASDANPQCTSRSLSYPGSEVTQRQSVSKTSFFGRNAKKSHSVGAISRNQQDELTTIAFPDIAAPLAMEVTDVKEKLVDLWWKNPTRKISLADVRSDPNLCVGCNILDDDQLLACLQDLEQCGLINKDLYLPQKTKREYFWLFVFQFVSSSLALVVEVVNGGAYTKSGMYYSWDIRLSAFFLGLVFLGLYYRKYHALRDLTTDRSCCDLKNYLSVICGCKTQNHLSAAPVEEEIRKYLEDPLGERESRKYSSPSHVKDESSCSKCREGQQSEDFEEATKEIDQKCLP